MRGVTGWGEKAWSSFFIDHFIISLPPTQWLTQENLGVLPYSSCRILHLIAVSCRSKFGNWWVTFGPKMCFVWPYAALSLKKKKWGHYFWNGIFCMKSKRLVSLHQKTKTETWAVFPHVAILELQLPPLEIFFSSFSHLLPCLSPCLLHCFMLPAVSVWTCNSYFIQPLKSQISSVALLRHYHRWWIIVMAS